MVAAGPLAVNGPGRGGIRHCERGEAIQIGPRVTPVDCFVASPPAMKRRCVDA